MILRLFGVVKIVLILVHFLILLVSFGGSAFHRFFLFKSRLVCFWLLGADFIGFCLDLLNGLLFLLFLRWIRFNPKCPGFNSISSLILTFLNGILIYPSRVLLFLLLILKFDSFVHLFPLRLFGILPWKINILILRICGFYLSYSSHLEGHEWYALNHHQFGGLLYPFPSEDPRIIGRIKLISIGLASFVKIVNCLFLWLFSLILKINIPVLFYHSQTYKINDILILFKYATPL